MGDIADSFFQAISTSTGIQRFPTLCHPVDRQIRRDGGTRRCIVIRIIERRLGDILQQRSHRRSGSDHRGGIPADRGVLKIGGLSGDVAIGVTEEAAVEIDAGIGGRKTVGQLDAALGIAELAIDGGEVVEALADAEDGVGGAGDGEAVAADGDVLVDELHAVDEVDIEGLGVAGLVGAANGEKDLRRGVVGAGKGEEEEEEEEWRH